MTARQPIEARVISIEGYDFLDDSVEVARFWVENEGPATCLIQPERLAQPEMFGMLMVDGIRHAAAAYAQCHQISETDALARIWAGFDAERHDESSPIQTLQDFGRLN